MRATFRRSSFNGAEADVGSSALALRLLLLAVAVVLLPRVVIGATVWLLVLQPIVVADVIPQARSTFAGALALRL
jgi:hypothetical protein